MPKYNAHENICNTASDYVLSHRYAADAWDKCDVSWWLFQALREFRLVSDKEYRKFAVQLIADTKTRDGKAILAVLLPEYKAAYNLLTQYVDGKDTKEDILKIKRKLKESIEDTGPYRDEHNMVFDSCHLSIRHTIEDVLWAHALRRHSHITGVSTQMDAATRYECFTIRKHFGNPFRNIGCTANKK